MIDFRRLPRVYLEGRIEIVQGDITKLAVDALVNAAKSSLLGGGGVDGAIHAAAGPKLLKECRGLGGAQTGEAKMTRGYRLRANHVIHAVGPVWHGGSAGEPELLASCYRNACELVQRGGLRTVAFPCISTGIYGYPIEPAAVVAQSTVREWLLGHDLPERVIFCCFSSNDLAVYERIAAVELVKKP
jgi:O-acetyl-ADP-ribose deacetylase (regulator of RNase III)